jgi:hypothetical protein
MGGDACPAVLSLDEPIISERPGAVSLSMRLSAESVGVWEITSEGLAGFCVAPRRTVGGFPIISERPGAVSLSMRLTAESVGVWERTSEGLAGVGPLELPTGGVGFPRGVMGIEDLASAANSTFPPRGLAGAEEMTSAADRTSPPRGFAEVWEPTLKGMGRVPSARFEGRASDREPFLGGVLAPVEGPCSQETKWC